MLRVLALNKSKPLQIYLLRSCSTVWTHLIKRGLDRSYRNTTESIPGVRGRIELSESIKQMTFIKGQAVCSFDELTHDIPSNQILKATLRKLIATQGLNLDLKRDLRDLIAKFSGVTDIRISAESFRKIQLHSNNGFYRILLHVCQLLHHQLLPVQGAEGYQFIDFGEEQLERVFEGFVRNFYKKEQSKYRVQRDFFDWQVDERTEDVATYVPKMETDTTLLSSAKRIVIETKFYQRTLSSRSDYGTKRIQSGHLFQLFAYLQNLTARDTIPSDGILLYPTVDEDYDINFSAFDHAIRVATVDLNQDHQTIKKRLLGLIDPPTDSASTKEVHI